MYILLLGPPRQNSFFFRKLLEIIDNLFIIIFRHKKYNYIKFFNNFSTFDAQENKKSFRCQIWHQSVNVDTFGVNIDTWHLWHLTLFWHFFVDTLTPVSILTLFYWHFWHGVNFDTLVFDTFDTFWHLSSPNVKYLIVSCLFEKVGYHSSRSLNGRKWWFL